MRNLTLAELRLITLRSIVGYLAQIDRPHAERLAGMRGALISATAHDPELAPLLEILPSIEADVAARLDHERAERQLLLDAILRGMADAEASMRDSGLLKQD